MVLQLIFPLVIAKQGFPYGGRDMKVGINAAKLESMWEFLYALMQLDPRGGYYRQADMQTAWHEGAAVAGVKNAMLIIAQVNKMKYEDFVADVVYAVRVVCSHAREKFRSWVTAASTLPKHPELENL